jgi:hypothetical protein
VANIRRLMAGEEQESMLPWWRGFKGTIKKTGEHKYDVTGIARKVNDTTVEIVELPIHKWTQTYKAELEVMIGDKGDGVVKVFVLPPVYCALNKTHCRTIKNITTTSMYISWSIWRPRTSKRQKSRVSLSSSSLRAR